MASDPVLAPNQARFVDEYLVDLNATQAAIRAGYSAKTADRQGPRLLGNAVVAAEIAARQAARAERVGFTADEVLRELGHLIRSDVRDFSFDEETGDLMLREGAPDEAWRAVASVKRKVRTIPQEDGDPIIEREMEFKLWDKNTALGNAMKHLGLLKDGASIVLNTQTNVLVWRFGDREVPFK